MAIQIASKEELDLVSAQLSSIKADTLAARLMAESQSGIFALGEATLSRLGQWANYVPVANNTHYTYFTAAKTETVSKIWTQNRGTAGAGITDARFGVYEYAPDTGNVTRVAVTANDITLFNTTFKIAEVPFLAPFEKVAGRRYAVGLRLSATTMPNFLGRLSEFGTALPPVNGYSFGTDLPAGPMGAPAGVSGTTFSLYYELRR